MTTMKKIFGATTALAMGTLSAQAGGIQRSVFNPGFLFEQGNYFEVTFGAVSPDVSGTALGAFSGDMASSYTTVSTSLKYQLSDDFALGLVFDQPVGVDVAYPTGTGYTFAGASATVTAEQLSVLAHYRLSDAFSVYGGLRAQRAQGRADDVTIDIDPTAGVTLFSYDMATQSDMAYGYVLGVAYERSDIALRVALTYVSAMTHDFSATDNLPVPGTVDFSTEIPQSINLDFQTGIAADTLLFGSIRWRDWSEFTIIPREGSAAAVPLSSDNKDTVTYALGVGRRFSDTFSGSVSVAHEPAGGGLVGNLGPTDGFTSVTLAGVYTAPTGLKVTVGASYGWIGDATTSTIGGRFTDNSFSGVGVRVGYSF
jgi:long-chain fatty acid transport protein